MSEEQIIGSPGAAEQPRADAGSHPTLAHTPGRWFWALDKSNQRTALMRSGTGDYVTSPQADISNYGLSVDCWTDVSDADAALIEAAPDLLEALLECRSGIAGFTATEGAADRLFNEIQRIHQVACAAIAKVMGPAQ